MVEEKSLGLVQNISKTTTLNKMVKLVHGNFNKTRYKLARSEEIHKSFKTNVKTPLLT